MRSIIIISVHDVAPEYGDSVPGAHSAPIKCITRNKKRQNIKNNGNNMAICTWRGAIGTVVSRITQNARDGIAGTRGVDRVDVVRYQDLRAKVGVIKRVLAIRVGN